MTPARVSRSLALLICSRAGNACEYCRLPQEWQEAEFHFDHVIPRVDRGATAADNLALACVGCSLHKGRKTTALDPASLQSVRLFNPRKDRFEDHFQWDRRWRMFGLTAIGRATIVALDLNRDRLLAIRRDLATMKRFPPP